jgi:hypothetical protein
MLPSKFVSRTVVLALIAAGVSVAAVLPTAVVQDMAGEQERAAKADPLDLAARQVGTWDVAATFAGMPEDKGTSVVRLVGGHWAVEDYKGSYAGEPYEGAGIFGFDTEKQKYVGVWAGAGDTRLSVTESVFDEATQTLTHEEQPMDLGEGPIPVIGKLKFVDADHLVFTMQKKGAEPDADPIMHLRYSRKQ